MRERKVKYKWNDQQAKKKSNKKKKEREKKREKGMDLNTSLHHN